MSAARFRIGELSRRTGVSPALLRAWEQRYGLLDPARSDGGTRLYGDEDLARVRAMRAGLAAGLSAAEAAAAVRTAPSELGRAAADLRAALGRLDRPGAEQAFNHLLRLCSFETLVADVVLPYLEDVGERWTRGTASIAEEHLATQVLRSRILALGDGLVPYTGRRAVLACPPEERHDLALVILAVALERSGWQVTLLGADTPVSSVADAAAMIDAHVVVLAATTSERFAEVVDQLADLARRRPLLLAGPGATAGLATATGATRLDADPLRAAAAIGAPLHEASLR